MTERVEMTSSSLRQDWEAPRRVSGRELLWVAALSLTAAYLFFFEYFPPFQRVHLWSDIAGYHYPLHLYAFQSWKAGNVPEWDPSIYCGISFIGNVQAAPLYPVTWLMYAAAWGAERFPFKVFEAFSFLHVWTAFLLSYVWLRGRAAGLASALGAMAFACGGFMMHQLLHPGVFGALAWLPLGLWGIDQGAQRRDWRPLWKVAAASALAFLAGYPAAWIVTCFTLMIYSVTVDPLWIAPRAALALAVSPLLIAAQLFPALEARSLMVWEPKYGAGAYDWRTLLAAHFTPNFLNFNPGHETTYEPGCAYLYLGLPVIFSLGWAVWRRRVSPYLPALGGAAAGLFFANPPHWLIALVHRTPFLNTTMQPFNFYAAVVPAAAWITALSVEHFLNGSGGRQARLSHWTAGLAVAALAVWTVRQIWIWTKGGQFASGWRSACETAIALSLLTAGLFCLRSARGRTRAMLAAVMLLFVAADYRVYGSGRWFNAMPGDPDEQYPLTEIGGVDAEAERQMRANRHYRVVTAESEGPHPTDYRRWGLATPEGFDPFLPAQYKALIERWVQFHTNRLFHTDLKNHEMMQSLGVRYVLARRGSPPDERLAENPDYRLLGAEDIFCHVYEYLRAKLPYRWEGVTAGHTVKLLRWEAGRREFEVDSPEGGRFVLAEQYFPGWEARVDGRAVRIERADGAFQAVELGPGKRRVEFRFRSRGLRWGLGINLPAVLACFWVARGGSRRRGRLATG